jgi:hypothetical protein
MAIAVNDRLSGPYTLAAAERGPHSFNFPIERASDLRVTRVRSGVETRLVHGADYTVTGVGATAGGTITLSADPAQGDILVIEGGEPVERQADAATSRLLADDDINNPGDRTTRQIQDLRRDAGRAVRVPLSESGPLVMQGRAERAHRVMAFGADGSPAPGPYTSFLEALLNLRQDAEDWGRVGEDVTEVVDWGNV